MSQSSWKSDITLYDIVLSIYNMINGEPDVKDPARHDLRDMYNQNQESYFTLIREQAKDFAKYAP